MTLRFTTPRPCMKQLPQYEGKTVARVVYGTDNGYGFVTVVFTDDTSIDVMEHGQAGEIKVTLNEGNPIWPQRED